MPTAQAHCSPCQHGAQATFAALPKLMATTGCRCTRDSQMLAPVLEHVCTQGSALARARTHTRAHASTLTHLGQSRLCPPPATRPLSCLSAPAPRTGSHQCPPRTRPKSPAPSRPSKAVEELNGIGAAGGHQG